MYDNDERHITALVTMERVQRVVRLAATLLGMILIIAGAVYALKTCEAVFRCLTNPEEASELVAEWEYAIGPDAIVITVDASEINAGLVEQLERLGPFGAGNPEPVFEVDGLYVLKKRVVGRGHLKLEMKTPTGTVAGFGPKLGETLEQIPPLVRVAATPTRDDWRGEGYVELRLAAAPIEGS